MHDATSPAAAACPRCQARPRPPRLTMSYMLHRIREDVFGSERGLLPTIWHLLVAPQRVAHAFIRGDDLRYFGPAKYFIVVVAVSILLATSQPFFDGLIVQQIVQNKLLDKASALAFVQDWNGLLYAPLAFLLAGLACYFFRAAGYNYAEHLVIAAYGWSHVLLLGTLAMLAAAGLKAMGLRGAILLPLLLSPIAYWLWYCCRVYSQRPAMGGVRALCCLVSSTVGYLLLLGAVIGVAGFWPGIP